LFLFKNLVGDALMPYALALFALLAGVSLLWIKRRTGLGRLLVTLAALTFLVAGCDPVAKRLVGSLENEFVPIEDTADLAGIQWIVVLGGGHAADATLPPTTRLNSAALSRLTEGIRLQRQLPGSRILFSGYTSRISHARVMAEAAIALGVDPSLIELEERTRDTEDEARLIGARLAGQRFVLVTSAVHMRRAVSLFRSEGADFVPAPADYASRSGPIGFRTWIFPSWDALGATERMAHEYLGIAWAALGGG
jgi:uncharacterized SAM-binding protein YcdF (DUF218 family)